MREVEPSISRINVDGVEVYFSTTVDAHGVCDGVDVEDADDEDDGVPYGTADASVVDQAAWEKQRAKQVALEHPPAPKNFELDDWYKQQAVPQQVGS